VEESAIERLVNISFPKNVGEWSIFHYHFFLPLLLFNLRHPNIFKICPTSDCMGIPDGIYPMGYTHQCSFVPVFQKCPELARGEECLQYDILEILNFVEFFPNNCGTNQFKIMLIKNNCR
jgi:hypothetical protein